MLLTLPKHDEITKCISVWSEDVIKTAERNGFKITDIREKGVTKSKIEYNIKSKNPKLLLFNGHGRDDVIAGHDNKPIIILGENDDLLNSKIVHSFSCSSAKELGKKCKAEAFIGYDDLFWLYMDGNNLSNPLKDKKVRPFMESAIEAPKQLAKRKTAKEAYEKSQKKYQKWIDELTLSSSKHTSEELQVILPLLQFNKNCQVIHTKK